MNEATKRRWDVRLGIAAPVLTVIGILVGVWQFNAGEEDRRKLQEAATLHKDAMEFRRKLWLERLDAYRSVAALSGKIVAQAESDKSDEQFKQAVREFTAAYWGTMILVEDQDVEKAMVNFYLELVNFQGNWDTLDRSQSPLSRLKIRADQLIKACRNSTEGSKP
jgi:hypothetical protein